MTDWFIDWLTDSANSAYIRTTSIPQATLKYHYAAPTHIYTLEAKNRRLRVSESAIRALDQKCVWKG